MYMFCYSSAASFLMRTVGKPSNDGGKWCSFDQASLRSMECEACLAPHDLPVQESNGRIHVGILQIHRSANSLRVQHIYTVVIC